MSFYIKKYLEIRNNYCISYLGNNLDYLVQLEYLIPIIKLQFDINLYVLCSPQYSKLFPNFFTNINQAKDQCIYISKLSCNMSQHPIFEFIKNSKINIKPLMPNITNHECLIVANGNFPTKSLTNEQIEKSKQYVTSLGYSYRIGDNLENESWIVGVESFALFKAGCQSRKVSLIPTGIGEDLFKLYFLGEILNF